jgi:hypothetical protein
MDYNLNWVSKDSEREDNCPCTSINSDENVPETEHGRRETLMHR